MNASRRLTLVSLLLVTSACNCGKRSSPGVSTAPDAGIDYARVSPTTLGIAPADAVFTTDGRTPATAHYTATATWSDGHSEDVTDRASFSLQNLTLGAFVGGNFRSTLDHGGRTVAVASLGALFASTPLTVKLEQAVTDSASMNIPADVAQHFNGTNVASRAPALVYPNDGVLLPPNLGKLELHFLPGTGNTLFELSFKSPYSNVRVYARCTMPLNGGCIYLPEPGVWKALADTNRGGAPVVVSVKGTDDTGAEHGESATLSLYFSLDDILGGLYYWTTTTKAIMRYDFASPTQSTAQAFATSTVTGDTKVDCIGCHALSRDGSKMIVEAEGSADGRIALLDVRTRDLKVPFPLSNRSFFSSWAPDSTKFVGVDDRGTDFNLRVYDGNNGQLVESIAGTGDLTRPTDHPDWSADGKTIAYASVTRQGPRAVSLQWPTNGSIRMVQQQPNGGWGLPVVIAPAVSGHNRFYPAISPSNDFLVFDESTCAVGDVGLDCDGDTDVNAKLYAAPLEANAKLVPLTKANSPGVRDNGKSDLTNSFPKWSPFNFQRTGELGSKLQWLTFSSSRAYGLRSPAQVKGADGVTRDLVWLWMVAVDSDQLKAGNDPSYTAFCLPFQDLSTSNHIAQWTQVVVTGIN